jgi:hypothetical protein
MLRLAVAALLCTGLVSLAQAQQVPGRDLLEFQVGTIGEPPALAHLAGDGFWNPASIALPVGARARLSAATLHTPSDQAVSAQMLSASLRLPGASTVALGIVRAEVTDLLRTDTDPQTIGVIPYNTTVASATFARRHEGFVIGLAVRYRHGEADALRRGALGLDAGVLATDLFGTDRVRFGASTFLWRPGGNGSTRHIRFNVASDVRLAGTDSVQEARMGYALSLGDDRGHEHFGFIAARQGPVEARAGLARNEAFGNVDWRLRLGLGVHHARYTVGVAREENGAGLAPIYQFTLSALWQ